MILSVTAITAFISSFLALCLSVVVYLGSHERSPRALGVMNFFIALWILSRAVVFSLPPESIALGTAVNKLSFFIGTLVSASFTFFALSYPNNTKATEKQTILVVSAVLILLPVYFNESLFLGKVYPVDGLQRFAWEQGPYLPFYDFVFLSLWVWGLMVVFINARKEIGEKRSHMMFMFNSMLFAGIIPAGLFTLILPRFFGIFEEWVASFTLSIWVGFASYAILKLRDMKVRYELSELYILICSLLLLINVFLPY
jgi:hypothetical protein